MRPSTRGSGGDPWTPATQPERKTMTDKLRVAVVGAGRWARRAHIPGWQRDPRAEVVALADTDPAVLASTGREFGVTRLVTDYRELLDEPGIDVVDVVT